MPTAFRKRTSPPSKQEKLGDTSKTEAQVRDPVIRWAKRNHVLHMRNHKGPGAEAGWPDDFFFPPGGRPFLVEFKRPGAKASKLQEFRIRDLKRLGYDVSVFDNSDQAIAALEARCSRGGPGVLHIGGGVRI